MKTKDIIIGETYAATSNAWQEPVLVRVLDTGQRRKMRDNYGSASDGVLIEGVIEGEKMHWRWAQDGTYVARPADIKRRCSIEEHKAEKQAEEEAKIARRRRMTRALERQVKLVEALKARGAHDARIDPGGWWDVPASSLAWPGGRVRMGEVTLLAAFDIEPADIEPDGDE